MPETTAGTGTANDSRVDTTTEVLTEDARAEAQRAVEGARAKVDKQRTHLVSAEQALDAAEYALKQLGA